jgi:hypothetical protein
VPSVVKDFKLEPQRTQRNTEKSRFMEAIHTPDPIVDPERLFEGFEN